MVQNADQNGQICQKMLNVKISEGVIPASLVRLCERIYEAEIEGENILEMDKYGCREGGLGDNQHHYCSHNLVELKKH